MDTQLSSSAKQRIAEILRDKGLSVTERRKTILAIFLNHDDALTHADIERGAGPSFDRVTIYRTLQTFEEKGLIHSIPTADNSVLYALCKDCGEGHHHDDHVHFVCDRCGKTYCLDNVVSPELKLPEGYRPANVQVLINGVCRECTAKSSR